MYSSEFFSNMQTQALERWRDVEKQSGQELLQENGLLFYGEDTGETVEGSVLGAKETMDNLGLPYTFYETGDEIANAYPSLEGCRGKPFSGVREDTAGHIKASKGNFRNILSHQGTSHHEFYLYSLRSNGPSCLRQMPSLTEDQTYSFEPRCKWKSRCYHERREINHCE